MAHITFYTKLGCGTSIKQVEFLEQSGHEVEVRDLLAEPWTAEQLASYFGDLPVAACFNPNSPRVKSGEIDPETYDREAALTMMLADHLLIRHPLMESDGNRLCGFDLATVHGWVGLGNAVCEWSVNEDFANCSQPAGATLQRCP